MAAKLEPLKRATAIKPILVRISDAELLAAIKTLGGNKTSTGVTHVLSHFRDEIISTAKSFKPKKKAS